MEYLRYIDNNDVHKIRELKKEGFDINAKLSKHYYCPLLHALIRCSLDIARELIKLGADPNLTDEFGVTILMKVIAYNLCPEAIPMLIKNGANVNAKTHFNDTALVYASRNNNVVQIQTLLDYGVNPFYRNDIGLNALDVARNFHLEDSINILKSLYPTYTYTIDNAIKDCDMEEVIRLISENVKIPKNALFSALKCPDPIFDILMEAGADINAQNMNGDTVLMIALKNFPEKLHQVMSYYSPDVLDLLLSGINDKNYNELVLFIVSKDEYAPYYKVILKYQHELFRATKDRLKYSLYTAIHKGNVKLATFLLKLGIQPYDKTFRDMVMENKESMVKTLLPYTNFKMIRRMSIESPNPNIRHLLNKQIERTFSQISKSGKTGKSEALEYLLPLLISPYLGKVESDILIDIINKLHITSDDVIVIKKIIEDNPQLVNFRNKNDFPYITLLHMAAMNSLTDLAKFLINHGAEVNVIDDNGFTPLMFATRKGDTEIVRYLINNKADPLIRDRSNNNALLFAIFSKKSNELVNLLLPLYPKLDVELTLVRLIDLDPNNRYIPVLQQYIRNNNNQ